MPIVKKSLSHQVTPRLRSGQSRSPRGRVIFLVGPTAVGKSEAAVYLAEKIKAEIVSCDSMQIYKGMDITTSKPGLGLLRRVPHHMIDFINPAQEYNVSKYRRAALKEIKEILHKDRVPLFVGGTGLYMTILVDGIFEFKTEDEAIRRRLYKEIKKRGSPYLHSRLKKIDPLAAKKIHPNDARRIVRALEVFESTGKPISQLQRQRKGLSGEYEVLIFGLNMGRDKLYKRIDERVERMLERGLLKEVKGLLKKKLSRTAMAAIGIKELKGYFDGICGLEDAVELMKRNTRRYAKAQLTWFKKEKRIRWIKLGDKDTAKGVADKIWKKLS